MDRVLAEGCRYLAEIGMATPEDVERTEAEGSFRRADPAKVSDKARERGRGQLGTIGSGNHFLEIQRVERLFDPAAADALGLYKGQIVILVHTGSRGLGHQVCTDYVRAMDEVMARHGIKLPDRELACAPFQSKEASTLRRSRDQASFPHPRRPPRSRHAARRCSWPATRRWRTSRTSPIPSAAGDSSSASWFSRRSGSRTGP